MPQPVTTNINNDSEPQYVPSTIGKLGNVDPQVVLDRVASGDLLREIAADYGCSHPAVSVWIRKRVPPQVWDRVREMSIASRLERSNVAMETADDAITLARARESARLWMWRAEREHPTLYGQRQQITHEVGADLSAALERAHQRISVARQQQIGPVTIDNQSGTVSDSE
jgi:hypothetical protein